MINEQEKVPWPGFRYAPVRGLRDRLLARWLRTQRKNLRRVFAERGHVDLLADLEKLKRNPRRSFLQKNRVFQRIMNEYIARVTPRTSAAAVGGEAAPEPVAGNVAVPPVPDRNGPGPDDGVPGLAPEDGRG